MHQVDVAGRTLRPVAGGTSPAQVAQLAHALGETLSGQAPPEQVLVPIGPEIEPVEATGEVRERILAGGGQIPQAVDLIVRTSGSTSGQGHLVGTSTAALAASAHATAERLSGHGQWLATLPAQHVAGVQVLVRSLLAGTEPVLVDTTAGFKVSALAEAAWQTIERAQGLPCYVSLVPTQLVRVVADPGACAALRGFDRLLVGGAAIPPALRARAQEAGLAVVATYGMSETSGGCVYDGRALAGVRITVRDDQRIELRGPMMAYGYLDDPVTSAATFTSHEPATCYGSATPRDSAPGHGGERSVLTSDRGEFDGHTLTVLGRVDDVLITGGIKVDPGLVERTLGHLPAIAEVCVIGVPDEQWGQAVTAVVVPAAEHAPTPAWRTAGPQVRADLRAHVRTELSAAHAPQHVILAPELPLRGPGKIDRRTVAALAAAHLRRP